MLGVFNRGLTGWRFESALCGHGRTSQGGGGGATAIGGTISRQIELIRELTVPIDNQFEQDQTRLCPLQGFIQRGGRGGGIYPPHDFGKGGISPHQTAEQCFFNGHFSEVLQESVQKTNPLF